MTRGDEEASLEAENGRFERRQAAEGHGSNSLTVTGRPGESCCCTWHHLAAPSSADSYYHPAPGQRTHPAPSSTSHLAPGSPSSPAAQHWHRRYAPSRALA